MRSGKALVTGFDPRLLEALGWLEAEEIPGGSTIPSDSLTLLFGYTMPLKIRVRKTVVPPLLSAGGEATVKIEVVNLDNRSATSLNLTDDAWTTPYLEAGALQLLEKPGWTKGLLGPGESFIVTYRIHLSQEGVYTLTPAEVSYVYDVVKFTARSNPAYIKVSTPPIHVVLAVALTGIWRLSTRVLGITLSTGILLALTALIVLLEAQGFFKKRKSKEYAKKQ